jgi:AAA ATPase-like protein
VSAPEFDELARLLAESWSGRSSAEQSDFARDLTPPSPTVPPEAVRTVLARAALSGAVEPKALVHDVHADDVDRLLDVVSADFDRLLVEGRWAWTLTAGTRAEVLARLSAGDGLGGALDDVARIPTDTAGRLLRELAGADAGRRLGGLAGTAAQQALTWAVPLGGVAGELAEVRRRAGVTAIRDGYSTLLDHPVRGRDAELRRLRDFIAERGDPDNPVPLLAVTGVGGAGKSTVLAELVGSHLDRIIEGDPTAPVVIVIDFDRVAFRGDSEVELSFEVTRQLGYAAPIASADFSVLRHQTREERRETGDDVSQSSNRYESDSRSRSGFDAEASILVRMHGLENRPVVLVLDTFEEWQRDRPNPGLPRSSWNDPENRIAEWILRLNHQMGLRGLRVIVSGRAGVSGMDWVAARRPIRLGSLGRGSAIRVLRDLDIRRRAASSLVDAVGGNPLMLRVAARLYAKLTPEERQGFLSTAGETHGKLSQEVRQAVLFDRFLNHIRDKDVRRLAHPGLVLRLVTPDLVRHVLARHCGLGEIDQRTAEGLVDRLSDEVWLVKSTRDGLRHQPDVRRSMLRMMQADPAHADTVRRIHQEAVDWYQGDSPERLYHALMLETGDRPITEVEGISRWQALGASAAEFRPAVWAQVRALSGAELSDEEALHLPVEIWDPWAEKFGAELLSDDQAPRALEVFEARVRRRSDPSEPSWLAQAYCDSAQWGRYWATSHRSTVGDRVTRSRRYAMLDALAPGAEDYLLRFDHHLDDYLAARGVRGGDHAELSERLFLRLLRSSDDVPEHVREQWFDQAEDLLRRAGAEGIYPVEQFRRALIWASRPSSRFRLQSTSGLFRPDPRWVSDCGELFGFRPDLDLGTRSLPRSDVVLGDWARKFDGTWQDRPELSIDVLVRRPELIRVLRGDNPELRPAIRLAVAAVAAQHVLRSIADIAMELVPIPVRDLQGDQLKGHKSIVQLVEYVDRSGVMARFLAQLAEAYPDVELLHDTRAVFTAWDDAHDRLLSRTESSLRQVGQSGMDA